MTPLERAKATYWFICKDLEEGLNYGVAPELYDQCMEAIRSSKRAEGREIDSRTFAEEFYGEFYRKERKNEQA